MRITLNIVLVIATIWITTSVTAQFDKEKYRHAGVHKLSFYQNTYDSTAGENAEGLSGGGTPTLPAVSNVTSTAAASAGLTSGTSYLESSSLAITMNEHEIQELNHILEQSPTVSGSSKISQVTEQSTASRMDASSIEHHSSQIVGGSTASEADDNFAKNQSNINPTSADGMTANVSSNSTTQANSVVVMPTKRARTYIDDIFKQSLAWLGDTYTLSIVVPILGGFLFALVIIVTLYTFACIRRGCRRRRLRRKLLPETIRKMGTSDRARLLAETSDEEF